MNLNKDGSGRINAFDTRNFDAIIARVLGNEKDYDKLKGRLEKLEHKDTAGILNEYMSNGNNINKLDEMITQAEKGIKINANAHIGSGLAGGILNSPDENGKFDIENFAKGFIYGLTGSKLSSAALKRIKPEVYERLFDIAKRYSAIAKKSPEILGKIYPKPKARQ